MKEKSKVDYKDIFEKKTLSPPCDRASVSPAASIRSTRMDWRELVFRVSTRLPRLVGEPWPRASPKRGKMKR